MKFSGQGPVFLARAINGVPGVFFDIGCADELSAAFAVDKWTHKETCSGQRATDASGEKGKSLTVTLSMTEFKNENIALATRGVYVPTDTGTVTDETLPDDLVVGDYVALGGATPHMGVSAVVITDSDSPPNTMDAENYSVNGPGGMVKILDLTGMTQPLKAAYSYTDQGYTAMFAAGQVEYWIRYNYLNGQNADGPGIAEFYRIKFDPTSSLPLINEELMVFTLSGEVLIDTTKPAGGPLGQFGRISDGITA